ncbi:hypothetical protein LTR99_002014 [Exophiala xenobiotica]|uniref:Uncharacterized protein n=1 Tax=Vermiconidia calcicola TaxID=1690605 RepID=A0AAV9QH44_9PEZI|nr:hypothetical protein LTR92_004432 [Exophiala xenobiotica]KAK5529879.1 hypothetical protein LTR23_010568 [Chaetothyriales sp. CCFEE 6169]KAK5542648.1 hypothetical protein LTR25_002534 [Vermiconidia calcicola]KAK5272622.1 hypothetical protein LTR96_002253 [Exophiala xenobiotica]KAK5306323.1 hypothetical protein LTR99_002014 [Exophiala xenobiotica]
MAHTRGQGARPEGFAQYQPPKQTTSAKRRREDDEAANDSKRQRKAVTPEQPRPRGTFMFSTTRNRSLLTSAPPKLSRGRISPFTGRVIPPVERQNIPPQSSEGTDESYERARDPETPTQVPARAGGILGSVKKIFGYFTGAPGEAEQQTRQQQRGSPRGDAQRRQTPLPESAESESPPPSPRTPEPESPTPQPEILDSRIFTREHFKRRRMSRTHAGREQLAAMRDNNNEADSDPNPFNPVETSSTGKRKLASVNGEIPPPRRDGFGVDDSDLDTDHEVEGLEDTQLQNGQPSTPAKRTEPQTPLRSALRPYTFGNLGRSAKSVRISSQTSVKHVYGTYGRSGQYHGSMFTDPLEKPKKSDKSDTSDSSLSSISAREVSGMHSPTTLENTHNNMTPKFRLDTSIFDPNDDTWRPSLANPSPGHFRVPDMDEYMDEDEDTVTLDQETEDVPPQPSTPRMSHAELPGAAPATPSSNTQNESAMGDTAESRLEKARSDAQKYKPARSSRLSLSDLAESRSSSPPGEDSTFRESQIEVSMTPPIRATTHVDTPTQITLSPTPTPVARRRELDNTVIGEDGMTDYGREHQYDEWAANLDWPEPQTYVEAGIASQYIDDLVRKNWTERDSRESREFWNREFDAGLEAARKAEAEGRELVWITDPEEMMDA